MNNLQKNNLKVWFRVLLFILCMILSKEIKNGEEKGHGGAPIVFVTFVVIFSTQCFNLIVLVYICWYFKNFCVLLWWFLVYDNFKYIFYGVNKISRVKTYTKIHIFFGGAHTHFCIWLYFFSTYAKWMNILYKRRQGKTKCVYIGAIYFRGLNPDSLISLFKVGLSMIE